MPAKQTIEISALPGRIFPIKSISYTAGTIATISLLAKTRKQIIGWLDQVKDRRLFDVPGNPGPRLPGFDLTLGDGRRLKSCQILDESWAAPGLLVLSYQGDHWKDVDQLIADDCQEVTR